MVGLNGVNLGFAYAFASYIGLGFHYVDNPAAQWRGPLGIALIFPIIVSLVCFIIPESPRFLLMKGRVEEAREVVYKMHSSKNDLDQEFVRGEFYQMTKQTEQEKELTPSYVSDFLMLKIANS